MRLKCTAAGFARLADLDWEVEVEEVLSVPVVPFSAGEGERLRLLTLAWGEVRESVALESVEFLRAGGGSFLVGAGESESEELEESDDDSEDEGRALSAGSVLESLSESLSESLAEEEEDEEEGEACFLAFLGEGSASDSESELDEELSELDEELSELDEELEELESEEAFRFSLFVARSFTVFSSSELESEEVSELDEEEPDEDAVEGDVAFATPVSESLELLLSPSLSSLELASDELTSFSCAFC